MSNTFVTAFVVNVSSWKYSCSSFVHVSSRCIN